MSNTTTPLTSPGGSTNRASPYGAISCVVAILIVVIFLVRPSRIPRKRKSTSSDRDCLSGASDSMIDKFPSWLSLPLDFSTVPVMVVLVLWLMQVITLRDIYVALKGHEGSNLKPYSIILLFFTLAYMSLSLDVTGLFDFVACKAVALSAGSGRRLFITFFTLSSLITIVSSNDIVILTLTPIICSMAATAHLPLHTTHALLFSQFFAANVWSMLLFIGNPTNIVVAQAFNLDFISYSRWMALPTLAAGITCFVVLFIIFSLHLKAIDLPIAVAPQNAWKNFIDLPGAIFGSIAFSICIVFIATSSVTKIDIWIVTVVGAALMVAKDCFFDFKLYYFKTKSLNLTNNSPSGGENKDQFNDQISNISSSHEKNDDEIEMDQFNRKSNGESEKDDTVSLDLGESSLEQKSLEIHSLESSAKVPERVLPIVVSRLPWKVAPFVIGVFILVETMSITGLTGFFARIFSYAAGTSDTSGSIFFAVFIAGITSSIACNIVNNQPMTIMYTNVLLDPHLTIGPISLRGAMFAVVIGSNLGGNMTLVGALAGIMWKSILEDRGVALSPGLFAKYGCITMLPVLFMTCITLYSELVASKL